MTVSLARRALRFRMGGSHLPSANDTFVHISQVPLPRIELSVMLSRRKKFPPFIHSRRSWEMKRTLGLAAVLATLFLVTGCSGLHGKDRPTRDPARLPGAPALEGSPTSPAIPGMTGSSPVIPPARSVGSN
jgi:hypothetical protein